MEPEMKQVMDEVKGELVTQVAPIVTEKALEEILAKIPQKAGIFGGDNTKTDDERNKAVEYLKAKAEKDGVKAKALSAGSTGNGAELVPTFISDQIISLTEKDGLVRKLARKWPMGGMSEKVPTLSSLTAYRIGTDGAKITSSAPTTGGLTLTAKTVGVIIPVSKRVLRNSSVKLLDALSVLASEAFATLEDKWAILGLASGEGVMQHASVPTKTLGSGKTSYTDVAPEDLLDVISLMKEEALTGEKLRWVMSMSMLNHFRKLRYSIGSDKQDFLFAGMGDKTPGTIWDIGYDTRSFMPKVSDSSQAGKKFLALANFDYVVFGDENVYTMDVSDQATVTDTDGSTLINSFEQEMVAIKFTESIDIQLAEAANAFGTAKTAAS